VLAATMLAWDGKWLSDVPLERAPSWPSVWGDSRVRPGIVVGQRPGVIRAKDTQRVALRMACRRPGAHWSRRTMGHEAAHCCCVSRSGRQVLV
jgi:hypothetical protein